MSTYDSQPESPVRIAIASGKGGTGKTTVATNLAVTAAAMGIDTTYADCDVEEPNGHIFLKPSVIRSSQIGVPLPSVDEKKCIHCGACSSICRFGAIVSMAKSVLLFPELCHGCGGCLHACPTGAIEESIERTGDIEIGTSGKVHFIHGVLDIGQIRSTPLIKAVKQHAPQAELHIIDAPPGTSCPLLETVDGCDLVLLVTEPTPFGLNDLELAVETMIKLNLPYRVLINRAAPDKEPAVEQFCQRTESIIIGRIPDDRRIAESYSNGEMICDSLPEYRQVFKAVVKDSMSLARRSRDKIAHAEVNPT